MRFPALLCLLALLAVPLEASPPKPKAPSGLRVVAACTASGACQLIASWKRPPTWRTGDSVSVVWSQTAPSAATFPTRYPKGTADTLDLPRTVEGVSFTGKIVVTTGRIGSTTKPSATALWTAPAIPVAPPDPVDSLKVTSLRVVPPSLNGIAGSQALICPMATLEGGRKTRVAPWSPACESAYLVWAQS